MRRALRTLFVAEIVLAVRIAALCDWWSAAATRRLGKLSANTRGRA